VRYGFALRRIALTGPRLPTAELTFTRGLNVIAGPSDTGKSFVVQCIDYALGGGNSPKGIPEAERYTTVVLEIEANHDQRVYTLERSLRGGRVLLTTPGEADRSLAPKHKAGKEDTVSQFLLDLSGLGTKKVRTNQQGTTRPLSFRDIARLVLIDEETVIKATSPVLSEQVIHKTVESSVFRLLLTGMDDSSVIAKEDPKVAKGRQEGKEELLAALLQRARGELTDVGGDGNIVDERDRLSRLEATLLAATAQRDAEQANASPVESSRRAVWKQIRTVESKLNVLSELQTRFDLLQEQYASDLQRLEAISEAGARLGQLSEERCPMCGALAEHHDNSHPTERLAPADVAQACRAEAAKTSQLLQDLQTTRTATAAEVEQLMKERDARQAEFDAIAAHLKALLEQHVEVASKNVDEVRARRDACMKTVDALQRIQELEGLLRVEAHTPQKREPAEGPASIVSTGQAEPFSKEVESLLRAWHYPPNLDRVTFSETDQDVVISGRARNTHGKGVRAVYRAAFNLALLRHCVREQRPFPNLVLIDSPLIVYEEPDAGETEFPQDVKQHFWDSVKSSFTDAQVIILENRRQIPTDGIANVNVMLFTGNDKGRRGFIPDSRGSL
jgi:ElaB/YqjD/DUF883 family membrane-anchored ribosome-binding protein